jgi:hypothetical protein
MNFTMRNNKRDRLPQSFFDFSSHLRCLFLRRVRAQVEVFVPQHTADARLPPAVLVMPGDAAVLGRAAGEAAALPVKNDGDLSRV